MTNKSRHASQTMSGATLARLCGGVAILAIIALSFAQARSRRPEQSAAVQSVEITVAGVTSTRTAVEETIGTLTRAKVIRSIRLDKREAQIHGGAWRAMTLNEKRGLTLALAQYAVMNDASRIYVVDDMSGEHLAMFTPGSGIRVGPVERNTP